MRRQIHILLALLPAMAFGQQNLDTMIIKYTGTFNVTISDAKKIAENPVIVDTAKVSSKLVYGIQSARVPTFYSPEPIRPATLEGEPLKRLYKGYVRAGLGNYTTPYGELFFNNLRSKEASWGLHAKHLSSAATLKNAGYSGYSDDQINWYGKRFVRKFTVFGEADYSRNSLHYYGYDATVNSLSADFTRQVFSFISAGTGVQSHYKDSSKVNTDIRANYYNLSDLYKSQENNLKVNADFSTWYLSQKITLATGVDFYNNRLKKDTSNTVIMKFTPAIGMSGKLWDVSLRFGIYADVNDSKGRFHFYRGWT